MSDGFACTSLFLCILLTYRVVVPFISFLNLSMSNNRCVACGLDRRHTKCTLHVWPEEKREEWSKSMNVNSAWVNQHSTVRICNRHFTEDDYVMLHGDSGRKKLKHLAVPFLYDDQLVDGYNPPPYSPRHSPPLHDGTEEMSNAAESGREVAVKNEPAVADPIPGIQRPRFGIANSGSPIPSSPSSTPSKIALESVHAEPPLANDPGLTTPPRSYGPSQRFGVPMFSSATLATSMSNITFEGVPAEPSPTSSPATQDVDLTFSTPESIASTVSPKKKTPRRTGASRTEKHVVVDRELLTEFAKTMSCDVCDRRVTVATLREPRSGSESIPFVDWHCDRCDTGGRFELQKFLTTGNKKIRETAAESAIALTMSGICVAKAHVFSQLCGMRLPCKQTFYAMRDKFRETLIDRCQVDKDVLIQNMKEHRDPDGNLAGAVLAIDGQFDSPGYSASFCAVGIMDLRQRKIVRTELVRKCDSGYSSPGMENVGMKRGLDYLIGKGVKIAAVTIDRSAANIKLIREQYPTIRLQHDPWHMVKKINAVTNEMSKPKKHFMTKKWAPSIRNHTLCIMQQAHGNDEWLIKQYKIMLERHIIGDHSKCDHGAYTNEKGYYDPTSKEYLKLKSLLLTPALISSIGRCSLFLPTAALESHHACRNHWLTKAHHHDYETHVLGSFLADHDTNSNPVIIKRDKDDQIVSRGLCRRDSQKWTRTVVYVPKDRSWIPEFATLAKEKLQNPENSPLKSGRKRRHTDRRREEHGFFTPTERPDEETAQRKFAQRTKFRRENARDGILVPSNRYETHDDSPSKRPSTSTGRAYDI